MKITTVLAATALLASTTAFAAEAPPDALKAKGCMNCHAVDTRKVGPSFRDVAAKYKANTTAAEDLTTKIKSGQGHPKVSASNDEIRVGVDWILKQK